MRHTSRGQALVEYGLVISLAVVIAAAGLMLFGNAVSTMISNITTTFLANV